MSKKHILLLNSKDLSGNKADSVFHLNDEHLHNAKSCQFKSISMPNLIYNINAYNNTLNYRDAVAVDLVATIPIGSYTLASFITAFNAAQPDITIANNTATSRFNFTSLTNTSIQVVSTLRDIIGITADTIPAVNYNAPSVYNFIYTNNIHILSNTLSECDNMISSNKKKYPMIATCPLDVGFGFLKIQDEDRDTSDYSVFQGHKNLSSIDIRITDDEFRTIDLNSANYILEFVILTN